MANHEERRYAGELSKLRREVRSSTTSAGLGNSSIDNGGKLIFIDRDGKEVMDVGGNPDGSFGATPRIGPVPPTATTPTLVPTPGGITVRWDGEYTDSLMTPDDFSRVEVHMGSTPDLTGVLAETIIGTIESPRGSDVPVHKLTGGATYYFLLVVRNTAGSRGPVSLMAAGTPLPALDGPGTTNAINKAEAARLLAIEAKAKADAASAAANTADQTAILAQNSATAALTAANGKSKLWYGTVAPTASQGSDGDMWWQRNGSTQVVTAVFEKAGGVWSSRKLSSSTIDTITAGQITTGTLNAATTITTGDPLGVHTTIGQSSIQVFRPDPEGDVQPTISIGGAARDVLMIMDPSTGSTLAGFDGTGGGVAQSFDTGELSVAGSPVGQMYERDDVLFQLPRGVVASFAPTADSTKAAATQLGICEVSATCYPYRLYRATFEGNFYCDTVGAYRLFLRCTTDGSMPTITSNQLTMGIFPTANIPGHTHANISGYFFVGSSSGPSSPVRVLLSIHRTTGGGTCWYHHDGGITPGRFVIEDIGPTSGVTSDLWDDGQKNTGKGVPPTGGGPISEPVAGRQTTTTTWQASWSRTWRSGSVRGDTADLVQGNYSGQQYAAFGFPAAMTSAIRNSKISNIQVFVNAKSWWYNNGGTAVISTHGSASAPASFPSGNNTITRAWTTKSGGKWMTLPADWYPYWETGNQQGITLGSGASSSLSYYGRFYGATAGAGYRPQIKITYRK